MTRPAPVFALRPLTVHMVRMLDPEISLADLDADRAGIGYC
ncbi:hypothetical protein [Micromonospora sp. CPCC 206061]